MRRLSRLLQSGLEAPWHDILSSNGSRTLKTSRASAAWATATNPRIRRLTLGFTRGRLELPVKENAQTLFCSPKAGIVTMALGERFLPSAARRIIAMKCRLIPCLIVLPLLGLSAGCTSDAACKTTVELVRKCRSEAGVPLGGNLERQIAMCSEARTSLPEVRDEIDCALSAGGQCQAYRSCHRDVQRRRLFTEALRMRQGGWTPSREWCDIFEKHRSSYPEIDILCPVEAVPRASGSAASAAPSGHRNGMSSPGVKSEMIP